MRLLGIDFGFKRIGIAIAETTVGIASPRPGIEAAGALRKDAQTIASIAKDEQVDAIVVGLPLEEGVEGRMARICRQLGGHLHDLGYRVEFVDESLSSVEAERTLMLDDLKASQRRKLRDGEAARLILERFMHAEASD